MIYIISLITKSSINHIILIYNIKFDILKQILDDNNRVIVSYIGLQQFNKIIIKVLKNCFLMHLYSKMIESQLVLYIKARASGPREQ